MEMILLRFEIIPTKFREVEGGGEKNICKIKFCTATNWMVKMVFVELTISRIE